MSDEYFLSDGEIKVMLTSLRNSLSEGLFTGGDLRTGEDLLKKLKVNGEQREEFTEDTE